SSSSGIAVDSECLEAFQSLKIGKKFKYIIYKLSDDKKSIGVEKTSETSTYEEFVGALPEDDCRYAVYDFDFTLADGGPRNKIVFITWSPDSAKIKSKMIYASSKDALRRGLNGVAFDIQGTDFDEIAYDTVLGKASGPAGR
ncbi:cofilin, partial [Mortierella alpina]